MLDGVKDFIKNSKVAQFGLTLVVGVAIGALFYPTKHIEETVKQKYEEQISKINEEHKVETKTLNEQLDKVSSQMKSVVAEKESKITILTSQVKELKTSKQTTYYKIVHPDGTVEVKKSTQENTDESTKIVTQIQEEFKSKVASIEQKWQTIHRQMVSELKSDYSKKEESYEKRIAELESKKVVDINPKKYGMEVGATTNGSYYIHPSADIFGPLFLGMHAQIGGSQELGLGLGLRF